MHQRITVTFPMLLINSATVIADFFKVSRQLIRQTVSDKKICRQKPFCNKFIIINRDNNVPNNLAASATCGVQ